MSPEQAQILGYTVELRAALEEITDKRSQYGKPSAEEPFLLRRCRFLVNEIEAALTPKATWPTPPDAA